MVNPIVSRRPPVPGRLVMRSDRYWLWTVDSGGYIHAGRIVGAISADRTDLGARSIAPLRSQLAARGAYLDVRYRTGHSANGPLPTVPGGPALAGSVDAQSADLGAGEASATVTMRRPGVAVLSASYDPWWTATVNGRREPTRMVAPALVGVDAPAGTDRGVFRFHGYGAYAPLLVLSGLTLVIIGVAGRYGRAVPSSARSTATRGSE